MDFSNKYYRFPLNFLFFITNVTVYVEVILERINKKEGKWNVYLKNLIGLLLLILVLSIITWFVGVLFNVNITFVYYGFALFFFLILIFSFIRIDLKYNIMKIMSCIILLCLSRIRDNYWNKVIKNLLFKLILLVLWYLIINIIVTKIYLSLQLIYDPSIMNIATFSLYLVTLYIIFVYFPENKDIRSRRQKLVNILVTILINIILSKFTYNDVLNLDDLETVFLKILSWSLSVFLLIFSIIDYLSLIIANHKTPFSVLRQYVRRKRKANDKVDLALEFFKDEFANLKDIVQVYRQFNRDIQWFIYKNKISLKVLIMIVIFAFVYAPLTYYLIVNLTYTSFAINELNIAFIESELFIKVSTNTFLIGIIYLLINRGIAYIKLQFININLKKIIIIIQSLSLVILISMFILYFIFNQSFQGFNTNSALKYTTGLLVIILMLSSVCIFLIEKYIDRDNDVYKV